MSETVLMEVRDGVCHLTLNRPEKRNALDARIMRALDHQLKKAEGMHEARVIILNGAGTCFSAGVDFGFIGEIGSVSGSGGYRFRSIVSELQAVCNRMERIEKPVICALHGVAVGMGLELSLPADFRVMTSDCRISIPEVDFGLIPDVGGITRLMRLVGFSRAKEIIMTAREIPAESALSMGLVNRVSDPGKHLQEADELARHLIGKAPLALGIAKRVMDMGLHMDKYAVQDLEVLAQSLLIGTNDVMEGLSARLEKRKPQFTGE